MKKIIVFLAVLVAICFVFGMLKDILLKTALEKGVNRITGLKLSMGSFSAGVMRSVIDIKNLVVSNPAGFTERVMVDMPEVFVSYDLLALIKGKLHLPEVRLDLREFIVERNASGVVNVEALKKVAVERPARSRTIGQRGPAMPEFVIDKLHLKIGRVLYRDYSGASPVTREFAVDIDEEYSNVTDVQGFVGLIMTRALFRTGIARLANLDLSDIQSIASQVTQMAMDRAAQAASGSAGGTTSQTVQQAAGAVQDVLKMFGAGDKK